MLHLATFTDKISDVHRWFVFDLSSLSPTSGLHPHLVTASILSTASLCSWKSSNSSIHVLLYATSRAEHECRPNRWALARTHCPRQSDQRGSIYPWPYQQLAQAHYYKSISWEYGHMIRANNSYQLIFPWHVGLVCADIVHPSFLHPISGPTQPTPHFSPFFPRRASLSMHLTQAGP